ncbi:hypothetical protein ATKI12_8840 [Kitasatospora sp. Ki12]
MAGRSGRRQRQTAQAHLYRRLPAWPCAARRNTAVAATPRALLDAPPSALALQGVPTADTMPSPAPPPPILPEALVARHHRLRLAALRALPAARDCRGPGRLRPTAPPCADHGDVPLFRPVR